MISRLIDYWHIRLGIIVLLQETSAQRFTFKLNLVLVLTDRNYCQCQMLCTFQVG